MTDPVMDPSDFERRVLRIVGDVDYRRGAAWGVYRLKVDRDEQSTNGRLYLQVVCLAEDTYTHEPKVTGGGRFYLAEHMTDSAIVRKAMQAFDGFEHHETREAFTYKGVRVFGPHIDVEALLEVADRLDTQDAAVFYETISVPR